MIRELESYWLVDCVVNVGFPPRPTRVARPTSRKPSLVEPGAPPRKLVSERTSSLGSCRIQILTNTSEGMVDAVG